MGDREELPGPTRHSSTSAHRTSESEHEEGCRSDPRDCSSRRGGVRARLVVLTTGFPLFVLLRPPISYSMYAYLWLMYSRISQAAVDVEDGRTSSESNGSEMHS